MKVFGIILEANPFHYGHQYFINEIKKNISLTYLSQSLQLLLQCAVKSLF